MGGGGQTCLDDPGCVLGDARQVAEPTDVFGVNSEIVLVAHDEIGHGAGGVPVALINREPLLQRGGQGRAGRVRDTDAGLTEPALPSIPVHNDREAGAARVPTSG